ncbi:MAG: carbon storage regulator [Granulosicoccus sp.]|nr:carbon storage regulator [Granulosicoccus sp.]
MTELKTRKGQSIILNDNIRITVSKVNGNHVHLVVKAPDDVSVLHEKVYFAEIMDRVDKEVAAKKRLESIETNPTSRVTALFQALRAPLLRVFSFSQ